MFSAQSLWRRGSGHLGADLIRDRLRHLLVVIEMHRVLRPACGSFTLYEDENDNYNYEKGARATIPISWDDASHTLTIGDRVGQFPGMLQSRKFQIVFVGEGHGIGIGATPQPDKTVQYSGKQVNVTP